MTKYRGFCINSTSRVLFLFCLANCAISFNFAALAAVVPAMSVDLRQTENVISQISAYYMIPYGLAALAYVPLARKVSFRIILAGAMMVYGGLSLFCAHTESIALILAARIGMGLAAACVIPLCLIAIGRLYGKEMRGRMVGLFFSSSFLASVLGIAVSGLWNWRWLFIVPGILALLTTGLAILDRQWAGNDASRQPIDYLKVLSQPRTKRIFAFIFVLSFLYHGVHKWLAVYLHRQYDLQQWLISGYFLLIALAGVLGQNLGGQITDRKGRFFACYWGLALLGGATMLLIGKFPLAVLAIILSVFSIGWTIGHNGISTVLTDFPEESRSEMAGMNSAVRFFSGGLGFFFGGPFVEKNISITFFSFGLLMMAMLFLLNKVVPKVN